MANDKNKTLLALTSAAMGLFNTHTHANSMDENTFIDYKYSHYVEDDIEVENLNPGDEATRYDIQVHQFLLRTPVSNDTQLTVGATTESMTGASPWYVKSDADGNPVQVMSGATIEEERNDISFSFKTFSKNSDISYGVGYSAENDYRSINIGLGSSYTFNNKSSTVEWALGGTIDKIKPSDYEIFLNSPVPRPEKEDKDSISGLLGFTQIIDKNTLINTSFTYALYKGYLSDPYKQALVEGVRVADSRPETKSQLAWGLAGRRFVNAVDGALQADYRYYYNNWGIESHTVDVGWHQNLGSHLQFKPSIRYYNQSSALFYNHFYTQARTDEFYSSDYRLSEFEAVSIKISLSTTINLGTVDIPLTLSYEGYQSEGDNPGLVDFQFVSFGTGIKF